MSISMARFGSKLANMFSNDKKSNATTQATQAAAELEASQEKARKEAVKLTKTSRNGFPHRPTSVAYDLVQHLLAIGTKYGYVKLYGGEGVEYTLYHAASASSQSTFGHVSSTPSMSTAGATGGTSGSPITGSPVIGSTNSASCGAVLFMSFVVNEGALITYCEDSTISFWNLRQKQPGILFSKKLVNEKATAMHLPFQSNWLYLGTEKGNTYLLNVYNNFSQSGYDIKWNNVIELSQKTKPGKVVHLSDHPMDNSKILIGFDSGLIVLWNLKLKKGELRFYGTAETMSSICWFYDAKQFMSSHNNGSLIIWNCKGDTKPASVIIPHMNESDLIPKYNMIKKCSWEATKSGEQLIIFSDGLPSTDCPIRDAITIIRNNKLKTIIEMKERIVDFVVVNSSPWLSDNPTDPTALIVLLENSIVAIDLKSEGYPQFQYHHCFNLNESPITSLSYVVDPHRHFFQSLLASKEKNAADQKQAQSGGPSSTGIAGNATTSTTFFSSLPYPVTGGLKSSKPNMFPYGELVATGHEDGSIRLWNSSGLGLSFLHKIKTQKIFDKRRSDALEIDLPFKITAITIVANYLAVAAVGGHVTLYKYYTKCTSPDEELADFPLFEIPISYEYNQNEPAQSGTQNFVTNSDATKKELKSYFRTKIGFRRQQGFQPELICLLFWSQRPPVVTNINIYTKYNMLLFGTDESVVCVDYVNRTLLLNVAISDFYGTQDPFHRGQKSPKKSNKTISTDIEESQSETPHHLTKQATIDATSGPFHQMTLRDATSRSSSCSSLDNLAMNEGISFIAVNDYAFSLNANIKNAEFQQQINQVWLGTTYGSVIVLNTFFNTSAAASTNGIINQSDNQNMKPLHLLVPSGVVHSLKGQILDISFLDINGNLLSTTEDTTSSTKAPQSANSGSNTDLQSNDDFDINEFTYLSDSHLSNSIANNFYGAPTTASSTNNSSTINSNTSSSFNDSGINNPSPTSGTTSSFVNPFSNQPSIEETFKQTAATTASTNNSSNKTNKKSLSGTRSNKNDFNTTQDVSDKNHFAVLTSETLIKVIALPSQTCIYKYVVSEGVITKAKVVVVNALSYLTCYLANGGFLVFNLPNPTLKSNLSLISSSTTLREKELLERTARTFTFGSRGHAIHMCSPSEIQKLYLSTTTGSSNLSEMLSEFFDPKVVCPPPPKPNLFKSLFSNTPLDREELFGEASGKPSTSIIKNVDTEVQKTKKELSELQKLALERGEKLNALQMKTEEMTQAASAFAKNAHELANKYKNKNKFPF